MSQSQQSWRWGALRSLLFVPGSRADRFQKALDSGADAVCFDLEDAVPKAQKREARAIIGRLPMQGAAQVGRFLRINGLATADGLRDLLALAEAGHAPDALLVPKAVAPREMDLIGALLDPAPPLIAILETAAGVEAAAAIAAHPQVAALLFGSADYCADTGAAMQWDGLAYARGRIVAAAAAHRVLAIDGVWPDVQDDAGALADTQRIRGLGFRARCAIHPRQVPFIHQGFAPPAEELAKARRIVAAFEAGGGAAILVDGVMIDQPLYESALTTIQQAEPQGAEAHPR